MSINNFNPVGSITDHLNSDECTVILNRCCRCSHNLMRFLYGADLVAAPKHQAPHPPCSFDPRHCRSRVGANRRSFNSFSFSYLPPASFTVFLRYQQQLASI